MAQLVPALETCSTTMTQGERFVAQRLKALLSDQCIIWYDIPVGRNYRHPDFIILDPQKGLIFLEVKDWQARKIYAINPLNVDYRINGDIVKKKNPLVQVLEYARETVNILSSDKRLQQPEGNYRGQLGVAWGYGVIFTNITRKQLLQLTDEESLQNPWPDGKILCQDDLSDAVTPADFNAIIDRMFSTPYRSRLSPQQCEIVHHHVFPEIIIKPERPARPAILKVLDSQQELLAKNMGAGHRVIHGVAGSGKTLILLYRSQYLAESSEKPILVLCYNITLASYLSACISELGLNKKVHVYNFHAWCSKLVRKHSSDIHVTKSENAKENLENLFLAIEQAVQNGVLSDTGYGAVLIDEGHDFDSRWLATIARLFSADDQQLLLMYDDAQSLYHRNRGLDFSLSSVGIHARGRTSVLKINYRNTREILYFAFEFAREYFNKHHSQEIPLVMPEACGEEGQEPQVLRCHSAAEEAQFVMRWITSRYETTGRWGDIAILSPGVKSVETLCKALKNENIPFACCFSAEEKKRYNHREDNVHLLTWQSSKGLEFPFVAAVNSSYVRSHAKDASESIPALYVAFTRATRDLLVTYHQENMLSTHLDNFAD